MNANNSLPEPSKFQLYGKYFNYHINAMRLGKTPQLLNYCQIGVLFQTKRLILRDEIRHISVQNYNFSTKLIVSPVESCKLGIIMLLPYVLESNKVLILTSSEVNADKLSDNIYPSCNRDIKCFFERVGFETDINKLTNVLEPVRRIQTLEDSLNQTPNENLVVVPCQHVTSSATESALLIYQNKVIVQNLQEFLLHFDTLIVDNANDCESITIDRLVEEFNKASEWWNKKFFLISSKCNSSIPNLITISESFINGCSGPTSENVFSTEIPCMCKDEDEMVSEMNEICHHMNSVLNFQKHD